MKFTVHIAKDHTPYFVIEQDNSHDNPDMARELADELKEVFVGFSSNRNKRQSKQPKSRKDGQSKPRKRNSFEVIKD